MIFSRESSSKRAGLNLKARPVTGPERFPAFVLALCLWAGSALAEPLRVVVISDLNGSYGSTSYDPRITRAIDRIILLNPDLVISTGDMVAGQRRPHLSGAEIRAMWIAFHAVVSDRLEAAGIPFAVTPGNHDASAFGDPVLESLFQRTGVLMRLSGRHHAHYPAKKDGVLYISQANLGGGARKPIGDTRTGLNSFTLLEFPDDGPVKIMALRAPDFQTEVDLNALPAQIRSGVATLTRMDLAP